MHAFEDLEEGQRRELRAEYDTAASFYDKAHVRRSGGRVILESYGLPVAELIGGRVYRTDESQPESNTTARHMREFVRQITGIRKTTAELRDIPTI